MLLGMTSQRRGLAALLGVLSIAPLAMLIAVSMLEPWLLHQDLGNRELVSRWADVVRMVSGVTIIVTLVVFLTIVHRSSDPRLANKKALWTSVLLFANVFALPVFWFKFLRR